ncbi:unnamed protein product [Ilex paraguariensis]
MDLTATAIATNTTTAAIKTPEVESETPTRIQTSKPLYFSNGVLKRHQRFRHNPPLVVTYRECLKNHAASLGGHAVDGCGEFMPSPTATPTDPTSLKCAACGCHRNFHRRDPEEALTPPNIPTIEYQPHHRHHPPPPQPPPRGSSPNSPSPPPISSSYYPSAPHMLLALSAGLSGPPLDNNQTIASTAATTGGVIASPSARKRFRTKFTPDQKEKMLEFADRLGWKMQKRDEDLINEFCSGVGVDKGVFKVWMHNNKNTFGKRENATNINDNNGNGNDIGIGFVSTNSTLETTTTNATHYHHQNDDKDDNHHQNLNPHLHSSDSVSAHVVPTNGSSSSS